MNILYISCHATLEYDEVSLFTEMGHDVFSLGAYHNLGHEDLPRPTIEGLKYHKELDEIYIANPNRTNLDKALINWADCIIVMHVPNIIIENWENIKHKRVIWRSIGQSTPHIENKLSRMRAEGLEIVRYSPKEANLKDYIGSNAMIRFYKDPDVYKGWNGAYPSVVNFAQSLKGRRDFCHYDEIFAVIEKYGGIIYGPGNEDLGKYNGGQIPFSQQLEVMRTSTVMIYGGTWPAAYTLSFIEALMVGLPIVAISKTLAHIPRYEPIDFYEVDEILAQISGIVCDSPEQMIKETNKLLTDKEHALLISERQRELAINMFGIDAIREQWRQFL